MNNMNSQASKMSKSQVIQLIDGQINQFSLLSSPGSPVASLREKFPSLFRQTVILIDKFISRDEALNFIEVIVSHFSYDILESTAEFTYTQDLYNKIKDLFTEADKDKLKKIFGEWIVKDSSNDKSSSNESDLDFVTKAAIVAACIPPVLLSIMGYGIYKDTKEQIKLKKAIRESSLECR